MKQPDAEELEKRRQADTAMEQVKKLYEIGRYGEALLMCRRVNEQVPRRGDTLLMLGMLYSRLGNPFEALENLAACLLVDGRNPRTLYHLAEVYLQTGSPVHALRSLRRLKEYWASDMKLHDLPDPRPLVERLDQSMVSEVGMTGLTRDQQEVAMMAAERGRLRLLFQGDPKRAASEFRTAIRFAPQYPQARNNLGLTYFLDGKPDKALAELKAVLEMHPNNVFALATMAFFRYASGSPAAECLESARSAAQLLGPEPRRPDVIKVAEVLNILGDDVICQQVVSALPPAEALLDGAVDGSENSRLALLAASLANSGRVDEAEETLRSATITFHDRFATRLLDAIMEGELPYGGRYLGVSWEAFMSPSVLARLTATATTPSARLLRGPLGSVRPAHLPQTLTRLYPRLTEACSLMLWLGDKDLEALAITLLGIVATPAAVDLLRCHMAGMLGSYSGRHDAGYTLLDGGYIENGTVLRFWMGTDWGEVQIFRLKPLGRDLVALATKLHELSEKLVRNDKVF